MELIRFYRDGLWVMSLSAWLTLGAALLLLIVLIAVVVGLWRRTEVKRRFGPEFQNAVEEYGSESAAVRELRAREKRVAKLPLHSLSDRQVNHVYAQWLKVQANFVTNPISGLRGASALVKSILHERGYANQSFEQRLADLSVDHPVVVQHYRDARRLGATNPDSPRATEDMRRAMLHYSAIIDELVEPTEKAASAWRGIRATS